MITRRLSYHAPFCRSGPAIPGYVRSRSTAALIDVSVFRWANRVSEKLDEGRMLVTEKVFGFLIAAIAVQLVLDGMVQIGVLASVPH